MPLLDLRELLVLVLASAAFTALCPAVYRRDPARRKLFLTVLSVVLAVAPWWTAVGLWTWPLGLEADAVSLLSRPVPWLAVAVWWSVGALLMARTLLGVRRGRRELRALPLLSSAAIDSECRGLAGQLGLAAPPSLRAGAAPCASSLGEPILVLPSGARAWPAATRRAVLCHELAHLKRLDDRLLLLVRLLADWYWWMPWLSRVHGRYLEAMEESCDDLASRLLASRRDYVDGLVQAARSLSGHGNHPDDAVAAWPVWASLLGHSHLAARVQRLLTASRPTLRYADGRWALLWASLAFAIGLTAQPSTVVPPVADAARLFPLAPPAAVPADADAAHRRPHVASRSYVLDPRTASWRRVPSARNPLPVYPGRALATGLEGVVTVDLRFLPGHSGLAQLGRPVISSSDPSGVLAAAVARALERSHGTGLGAGLRTASAYNNDITPPPPGTSLRLKTVYRFVLSGATRSGIPTPGVVTPSVLTPGVVTPSVVTPSVATPGTAPSSKGG